ncbi:MAG: hypothetical protein WCH99_18480 [Verrucomicrobiota bacterium]
MFTFLMVSGEFEDVIGRFLSHEPRQPLGGFHFAKKSQRAVRRIITIHRADVGKWLPEFKKNVVVYIHPWVPENKPENI